jgi:two-component system response regulator VicR
MTNEPRRVLIAEDDRQMSQILNAVLQKQGYEVECVFDGAEALRVLKIWHPHLLVLDIMLPIVDGFHICHTINEDHSFDPRPKILIVSGRGSDWDQNLGAACGAEDYLVKPFSNQHFADKVNQILSKSQ